MISSPFNFCLWQIRCNPVYLNFYLKISTYSPLFKKNGFNSAQRSKLARKFLNRNTFEMNRSQVKIQPKQKMISSSILYPNQESKLSKKNHGLDKIFMEKITEIISTTEILDKVSGKGLDILQTQVQKGFTSIHVYWTCSNCKDDEILNKTLTDAASFIRYELSSQQILGRIPPILFIRDSAHKNAVLIEKLLQEADFGEDFEPCHFMNFNREIATVQKKISKEVWENVNELMKKSDTDTDTSNGELPFFNPPLRQDIFGVNRDKIMNMVKIGRKMAKPSLSPPSYLPSKFEVQQGTPVIPSSSFARTADIRKWVSEYKKMRKKNVKREKNEINLSLSYIPIPDEEEAFESDFQDFEDYNNYIEEDYKSHNDHLD